MHYAEEAHGNLSNRWWEGAGSVVPALPYLAVYSTLFTPGCRLLYVLQIVSSLGNMLSMLTEDHLSLCRTASLCEESWLERFCPLVASYYCTPPNSSSNPLSGDSLRLHPEKAFIGQSLWALQSGNWTRGVGKTDLNLAVLRWKCPVLSPRFYTRKNVKRQTAQYLLIGN